MCLTFVCFWSLWLCFPGSFADVVVSSQLVESGKLGSCIHSPQSLGILLVAQLSSFSLLSSLGVAVRYIPQYAKLTLTDAIACVMVFIFIHLVFPEFLFDVNSVMLNMGLSVCDRHGSTDIDSNVHLGLLSSGERCVIICVVVSSCQFLGPLASLSDAFRRIMFEVF